MLFSKYLGWLAGWLSFLLQIPSHCATDRRTLLWKSDSSVARILQFGQNKTQRVTGT